ncbi:MAG: linear amide C-N hydrolase [Bacteroidaceae bacterium]|nr:linear amide C-N hydrolase [Bacteroidaceae bacterium]
MKKKIFIGLGVALVAVLVVFVVGGMRMFGNEINAIRSMEEVQPGIYTFTYKGDYGFKDFLEKGGAKTDAQMAGHIAEFLSHGHVKINVEAPDGGCTTVTDNGVFARNFDWEPSPLCAIIKTEPADGYASVSTSNLTFLGFGEDWQPDNFMHKMMALASVYVPLDGMNEKGVCVADLIEIDGDKQVPDSERPDLTIVSAIRLVLDYAATTDEAIALLSRYDVFPSVERMHHLSISDRSGHSVVVEWNDGQMQVTPTQVVTNHCLSEARQSDDTGESHQRFEMLTSRFLPLAGRDTPLQAIQAASYPQATLWSVVYDQQALTATHYFGCRWEEGIASALKP